MSYSLLLLVALGSNIWASDDHKNIHGATFPLLEDENWLSPLMTDLDPLIMGVAAHELNTPPLNTRNNDRLQQAMTENGIETSNHTVVEEPRGAVGYTPYPPHHIPPLPPVGFPTHPEPFPHHPNPQVVGHDLLPMVYEHAVDTDHLHLPSHPPFPAHSPRHVSYGSASAAYPLHYQTNAQFASHEHRPVTNGPMISADPLHYQVNPQLVGHDARHVTYGHAIAANPGHYQNFPEIPQVDPGMIPVGYGPPTMQQAYPQYLGSAVTNDQPTTILAPTDRGLWTYATGEVESMTNTPPVVRAHVAGSPPSPRIARVSASAQPNFGSYHQHVGIPRGGPSPFHPLPAQAVARNPRLVRLGYYQPTTRDHQSTTIDCMRAAHGGVIATNQAQSVMEDPQPAEPVHRPAVPATGAEFPRNHDNDMGVSNAGGLVYQQVAHQPLVGDTNFSRMDYTRDFEGGCQDVSVHITSPHRVQAPPNHPPYHRIEPKQLPCRLQSATSGNGDLPPIANIFETEEPDTQPLRELKVVLGDCMKPSVEVQPEYPKKAKKLDRIRILCTVCGTILLQQNFKKHKKAHKECAKAICELWNGCVDE